MDRLEMKDKFKKVLEEIDYTKPIYIQDSPAEEYISPPIKPKMHRDWYIDAIRYLDNDILFQL